jgi:hypothetical protein
LVGATTRFTELLKMATTYKLRAECENDITRFQKAMIKNNKTITKVSMEHQTLEMGDVSFPLPDVDFVFTSTNSLQEIKAVLKTVVDGHVMEETVAGLEDYTGERTYGADDEDDGSRVCIDCDKKFEENKHNIEDGWVSTKCECCTGECEEQCCAVPDHE